MATATATAAEAEAAAAVEAQKTRNSFKNANVHQRGSPKMAEFVVVSLFCQIVLLNFLENFCIVLHYIAPLLLFFFFFCFGRRFSSRCQNEMSEEVVAWRRQWTVLFCFVQFGLALFCFALFCSVCLASLDVLRFGTVRFWWTPRQTEYVASLTSLCNRKLTEQFFINPSLILHPVKVSLSLSLSVSCSKTRTKCDKEFINNCKVWLHNEALDTLRYDFLKKIF